MKYSPLCAISLKHSYYDHGYCPDFIIAPDAKTRKLLDNQRCVIKTDEYGLHIYVALKNAKDALIPFTDKTQLCFDLKLQNCEFLLYTDSQRITVSNADMQLYQANGPKMTPVQGIPALAPVNQPLLTLSIQRDFNKIQLPLISDEISFFAKSQLWYYYLISNQNSSDEFTLIDVGGSTPLISFESYQPTANDDVYKQLKMQYPSLSIFCFVSCQALECHESSKVQLQLKQGGSIIFDKLAKPDYRNFFTVSTTDQKPQTAIYKIVKYLINP